MAGKVSKPKEKTFEERLEQLEALAEKMEQGNLHLYELMAAYEEGAKLAAGLRAELEQVQARMMEIKLAQGEKPIPSGVVEQGSLPAPLEAEK